MKEFYSVGEISQLFQISTDTLRYYDKIGLLKPWMTKENKYRYYSKAQFEMISTILILRNIGTPIEKLQRILTNQDVSMLEQELITYGDVIDRKIQQLNHVKKQALSFSNNIKDTCYDEEISVRMVPKLYALLKEYDSEHDELDMNEIRSVNSSSNSTWISYANLISTLDKDLLWQGEYHTYKTYGYLSEYPCEVEQEGLLKVFPSRLCVCCNAKVERIDHMDIDRIYDKMLTFIKENQYHICDDTIERSILDLYGEAPGDLTIYFKLYIPINY